MSLASADKNTRPSSMPSEDFDAPSYLRPDAVLQAEVVLSANESNNVEGRRLPMEIDAEVYQITNQMEQDKNDRKSSRPLFVTLYVMLLLAATGLVVSITRYIVVKRKASPPSFSQDAAMGGDVSNTPTMSDVDPDRDPVTYRSDIEYILSRELHEECSTNFLEGAQKMAIDWLVYKDFVLTSDMIRAMAESSVSDGNGEDNRIATFPLVQRYAMMVLFFGTSGELWSGRPWTEMVDTTECMFMGVECNLEGQMVDLDLSFRKLRGRLPEEVGMLTKLVSANFLSNSLEGTIPSFLYNRLTNLEFLDLSRNEFSSSISSDISKLTSIKILHLSELSLTGQFPVDAMKSLSTLEQVAIAQATKMSGPLLELSESWPNLQLFDIYGSKFTGTIPTTIGTNTKLEYLWLDGVDMDLSIIPTEIGLLTNLKEIDFDSNHNLQGGGTIPTEIGNCESLNFIHATSYSGPIPTEIGRLVNLEDITFKDGMLTGSIPSEIGQLTKLTTLSLKNNQLEGTLPSEMGKLQGLKTLELFGNHLVGSIPRGLCMSPGILIFHDSNINECE